VVDPDQLELRQALHRLGRRRPATRDYEPRLVDESQEQPAVDGLPRGKLAGAVLPTIDTEGPDPGHPLLAVPGEGAAGRVGPGENSAGSRRARVLRIGQIPALHLLQDARQILED